MTFYKHTYRIEVISESDKPPEFHYLRDLEEEFTRGNSSGYFERTSMRILSAEQMIGECFAHNTDPEFFGLMLNKVKRNPLARPD